MSKAQDQAESTVIRAVPKWNSRLKSLWKRFWLSASAQRLMESLSSYPIELDHLIHLAEEKPVADKSWAMAATAYLKEAEEALQEGDEDRGWHCLLAAQRMELRGLQAVNPAGLQLRGKAIHCEALNKLKSWRKELVKGVLGSVVFEDGPLAMCHVAPLVAADSPGFSSTDQQTLSLEAIYEVACILHAHFDNEAVKRRAWIKQMKMLVCVALAVLVLWLALLLGSPDFRFDLKEAPKVGSAALTVTVMLFGLMGASLSGILSTSGDPGRVKIPDLLLSFRVTVARLVVAALSALTASVMIMSGFLKIGNMDATIGVILSAAVAAGFSERLVVSALSKATGEKVREEKLPPTPSTGTI